MGFSDRCEKVSKLAKSVGVSVDKLATKTAEWHDNGRIHVYLGVTGWNFTAMTSQGKKTGGVGYGSRESALKAAMAS